MKRRDFNLSLLGLSANGLMAGCGGGPPGTDMEYQIQPSPILRTSKNTFPAGVENDWTPVIRFLINGDLSVVYDLQLGHYIRLGSLIWCFFMIRTTTFTHTTAADELQITGLPFQPRLNPDNTIAFGSGNLLWRGITIATRVDMIPMPMALTNQFSIYASGTGLQPILVNASHMPTGGPVEFRGHVIYQTSEVS